jgi:hypothetical protein
VSLSLGLCGSIGLDYVPLDPNFKIQPVQITSVNIPSSTFSVPIVSSFHFNSDYCLSIAGIPEKSGNPNLKFFPNPVKDKLTISDIVPGQVSVYNATGVLIKVNTYNSELDFSDCPSGVYFLRIQTDRGIVSRKIVKE